MKLGFISLCLLFFYFPLVACAEGNCPSGQYPVGGQGAVGCAPIPGYQQSTSVESPRPTGRWIPTWGAIAMGSVDLVRNYGVSSGKRSKEEAENDAMARCSKHGEKDCQIGLAYFNQCVAVGEPQINGKPNLLGNVQFFGDAKIGKAAEAAQAACERRNPGDQCKVVYKACTEQIFEKF